MARRTDKYVREADVVNDLVLARRELRLLLEEAIKLDPEFKITQYLDVKTRNFIEHKFYNYQFELKVDSNIKTMDLNNLDKSKLYLNPIIKFHKTSEFRDMIISLGKNIRFKMERGVAYIQTGFQSDNYEKLGSFISTLSNQVKKYIEILKDKDKLESLIEDHIEDYKESLEEDKNNTKKPYKSLSGTKSKVTGNRRVIRNQVEENPLPKEDTVISDIESLFS